jgi:CRISPR-associated protein (TIGR03984 family)
MSTHKLANVETLNGPGGDAEVGGWLAQQATAKRPFLLAFADDGVIWGRWLAGKLVTAGEAVADSTTADPRSRDISPPLRGETLQQASVFGRMDEVRLFRDEMGRWQARRIGDGDDKIDERQLLVGNEVVAGYGEFTHVRDRIQQGIDHIVPVAITHQDVDAGRGPCLLVRHFVDYDDSGEARIVLSRLVEVSVGLRAED